MRLNQLSVDTVVFDFEFLSFDIVSAIFIRSGDIRISNLFSAGKNTNFRAKILIVRFVE